MYWAGYSAQYIVVNCKVQAAVLELVAYIPLGIGCAVFRAVDIIHDWNIFWYPLYLK